MSTLEQQIERVLRAAPSPAPPAGLKEWLIAEVRLPAARSPAPPLSPAGWLRRWWPVLVPASVSLACAAALTMQQMEIRDLKQAIQDLARDSAAKAATDPAPTPASNTMPAGPDAAARTQQEITRLKGLAGQLSTEVSKLEQMRAENGKLRIQLTMPPAGLLTPDETEALAKAKEKAESFHCVNNLKQLGLAVRVWAYENGEVSPSKLLEMTDEMSTPEILICPADHGREAAKDWASFTSANCSYEYLAPSAPETEPTRVLFRCPIHGHVALTDGSVQSELAKRHPEQLVQRDGKLYQVYQEEPAEAGRAESAEERFRRRYGLRHGLDEQPNQVVPVQPSTNPPPGDLPPGGSKQ